LNRNDRPSVPDIFEKIEIIPLETTNNSLLDFRSSSPNKTIKHNDCIYFLEIDRAMISVFTSDGKFLRRLDRKGRGPGEYLSINDFIVNRFTNNLEILSPELRCIFVYDLETFKPIETIPLPADLPAVHQFHNLTPDVYALVSYAGDVKLFFYSVKDGKTMEANYFLPEWFNNNTGYVSSRDYTFYVYNDELCFEQMYNGQVFTLSPDNYELIPRYSWDMGKHSFSPSVLPGNESADYYMRTTRDISMSFAILFQIFQENSRYYITRFRFKNRYKHLIYKKETQDYLLFETFAEGGQFIPEWSDDNAFYSVISPMYINLVINESMLDEKNQRIYSQIKEDDNPMIIKYTLK
jgi:hypothetical protein